MDPSFRMPTRSIALVTKQKTLGFINGSRGISRGVSKCPQEPL